MKKVNWENPFPERLKAAREAKGLTLAELGEAAGVSRQAICAYEHGKILPRVTTAYKLAAVLDVSLTCLFL